MVGEKGSGNEAVNAVHIASDDALLDPVTIQWKCERYKTRIRKLGRAICMEFTTGHFFYTGYIGGQLRTPRFRPKDHLSLMNANVRSQTDRTHGQQYTKTESQITFELQAAIAGQ